LIWLISLYAYSVAPSRVPTHFGMNGKPDSYGSKTTFLLIAPILSIAPIIFILIWKYRFSLIEKHPYLINLPAFFSIILNLGEEEKQKYIEKYFDYLLLLGIAITFAMLVLDAGICFAGIKGFAPPYFITISLLLIFIPTIIFIIYLRKMAYEVKTVK